MKGRKTGRCTFTKEQRLRGMLNNKIKAEERMKNTPWPELHRKKYKERILHEQNYKCAICQMDPIWNGKPLKFQLDHINGRINNNRENLRVVCPNCHSQTDNFCRTATKEGKNKLREVALKNFRKSTWKT